MTSKIALITGGAGFIGGYLAQNLVEKGYRVRVLDSLEEQVHGPGAEFPPYLDSYITCIRGDVEDADVVTQALDGVTIIFHLAALTGVGQSMYQIDRYTYANGAGTATLLQCLIDREQPVDRIVLASSRAVYGEGKYECATCGVVYPDSRLPGQLDDNRWDLVCPNCGAAVVPLPTDETSPVKPGSVYAINKHSQEELVRCVGKAYGFPFVLLRYFNVYGPRQSPSNPDTGLLITFLLRLLAGQNFEVFEDGQMLRDFVHVRDVVSATIAAAEKRDAVGETINVASGTGVTVAQLAGILLKVAGADVSAEQVGIARVGDIRHIVADIQKAQDLLEYRPRIGLQDGLEELVRWFQAQEGEPDRSGEAQGELRQRNLLR